MKQGYVPGLASTHGRWSLDAAVVYALLRAVTDLQQVCEQLLDRAEGAKSGEGRRPASSDPRYLLTVEEAAKRLSLKRAHMYALVARKVIPSVKLGPKSTRIPVAALEEWARNAASSGKGQ